MLPAMNPATCANTGLTRPECSCDACIRQLMIDHAPEAVWAADPGEAGGLGGLEELGEAREGLSVAERLARPAL